MTFVFPKSVQALNAGQDLYRVRAISPATGPGLGTVPQLQEFGLGDILPTSVGISAIAVGPDSVFEKYEITYPDVVQPSRVQTANLSTATPLFLPISAEKAPYPQTVQASNIFIRPLGLLTQASGGFTTILDLLIYIAGARPPLTAIKRNPQSASYPLRLQSGITLGYRFPAYGRRTFQVAIDRSALTNPGEDITLEVFGEKTLPAVGELFAPVRSWQLLPVTTITPAAGNFAFQHNADESGSLGRFDTYAINVGSNFSHDPSAAVARYSEVFLWAEMRD